MKEDFPLRIVNSSQRTRDGYWWGYWTGSRAGLCLWCLSSERREGGVPKVWSRGQPDKYQTLFCLSDNPHIDIDRGISWLTGIDLSSARGIKELSFSRYGSFTFKCSWNFSWWNHSFQCSSQSRYDIDSSLIPRPVYELRAKDYPSRWSTPCVLSMLWVPKRADKEREVGGHR